MINPMKDPAHSGALPPMPAAASSGDFISIRARRACAMLYGLYAWFLFVPVFLLAGALIMLLRRLTSRRSVARSACRLLFRGAGMPLHATGLDTLPPGTHVLLVNHSSFLDALVLLALLPSNPGYAFVVRQQFDSQRLLCPLLRALGTLVLGPPGSGRGTKAMRLALRHGTRLLVFPEGGFRPEPGLRPFHSGAFVAVSQLNVPIATAGLRGVRRALPSRSWLPRRTAIDLEIGPVLRPAPIDGGLLGQVAQARRCIALLSGELLVEQVPPAGLVGSAGVTHEQSFSSGDTTR
ncbi:MAG: 1-acyl-sn-glycerol-3-phosphate acyltransferase [Herminiimonas sp.]|nr:1-acyl-sn-glycerol-3-phosphate acyltransferase [Herminiimonas sp.]